MPKKVNAWVQFVRGFAKHHGVSYNEALSHPQCKEMYHAAKGGNGVKEELENAYNQSRDGVRRVLGVGLKQDAENLYNKSTGDLRKFISF